MDVAAVICFIIVILMILPCAVFGGSRLFSKFYCPTCNEIKSRFEVSATDCYYYTGYYCKYCHKETEYVNDMLCRVNQKLKQIDYSAQLGDLHDWVRREAVERYKGSPAEKKAFKKGVYALLDKIGFDYKGAKED